MKTFCSESGQTRRHLAVLGNYFGAMTMQKIVFVVFLMVGAACFWWLNSGSRHSNAAAGAATDVAAQEKNNPLRPASVNISQFPLPISGPVAHDPVVVTPCNIVPAQEQNISSQVDSILDEMLVDLGRQVSKGELLAKLDDQQVRAQAELLRIRATSESGQRIAKAQQDEAESKVAYALKANENGLIAVPELEYKTYVFQKERFAQEVNKAREDQEMARKELAKVEVVLNQHLISSGITGEIVKVFKRRGEAVKQAEPLFQVANIRRLRIEGLCKAQQADLLRIGMTALVEPESRGEQLMELAGHTAAVTSLSVSPDGRLLASASEDRTVILWSWPSGNRRCLLPHPSEVYALAFSLPKTQEDESHLVTGSADGQARLWTISAQGIVDGPRLFSECHENSIRALAFSKDGKWCATGGEDKRIGLWDAATGKHLYWLEADEGGTSVHKGAVTSLSFTADSHLISAGATIALKCGKSAQRRATW